MNPNINAESKNIKNGDLIKKTPDAKTVYIKGHYNRNEKDFSCSSYYDTNKEIFIKGNKNVYTGFTF